jgi:predicted AlkP superfamily phosphohydrolase/phosphomutase
VVDGSLPQRPTPLAKLRVDWSRTRAWSEGGYYARVFINRQGREPAGTVTPGEYEAFRRQLAVEIAAIPDDAGRPLATRVYTPEELYPVANGFPPDLLVLFGDLHWRSIGSVGHGHVAVLDNDTGPDEANHAQHGIYIAAGPGIAPAANVDRHLLDIAPWMLSMLGLPAAPQAQRRARDQ